MAHVKFDNISVSFPIYTAHTRSLKVDLTSRLGGRLASYNQSISVQALSNISLDLADGDRIGLIGHNGAGKTTFLRVVAGVYEPDQGQASIEGKIAALTDISLGMDPEATGWDNITFRCVFMGLSFADAKRLAPQIAEFSELGEYLQVPVRTYSSGMFVRLAFAISTSIYPDIIVMDEMISVGDQRFIDKAKKRIQELLDRSKILVLASHDLGLIKSVCNRVLWLEKGKVRAMGDPEMIVGEYLASANAG